MVTTLPSLKIVYATTWFGISKFQQDEGFGNECPIPEGYAFNLTQSDSSWCSITSSEEDMDSAAGLIFHAPDTFISKLPKHVKNQPWVLESLETPFASPFRSDVEFMKSNFDYLASYNFKSTFLFSYFSPSIMDVVNRPLPKDFIKTKTKAAPILWIAKNCRGVNGRENYIRKLMEYINVHSYGECLNNKPFPEDKSRLELMAEYKFYLAVENCNCDDYATEKLADTISVSAVPIVDGPPTYDGFIPTKRSVIHMDAYPDPKDLADYINYLNGNDTAYLEYLAFRRDAIDIAPKDRLEPAFINNWSDTIANKKRSSYCSVCRGLVPWWEARLTGKKTYKESRKDLFLVDKSCSPIGKWNYITDGPPYTPDWTPRPRDEFTRPIFNSSLQQQHDKESMIMSQETTRHGINSTTTLAANFSFVLLFAIFITFLYRESKKLSRRNTGEHVLIV